MRFLFVVQGEGRGHITQSITLLDMLQRNGHQVMEILVGQSEMRQLPAFFPEQANVPVYCFPSPNFLKTADNKHFRIFKSIICNLKKKQRKAYFGSVRFIAGRINQVNPDAVINFYELLCGLAYWRYKIQVPEICIAHQFIFEHSSYIFTHKLNLTQRLLRLYTVLCSLHAQKRIALSFTPMADDPKKKLLVAPPLLRRRLLSLKPEAQPYILGYILNHGYADEIIQWHRKYPEIAVHVFWDKPNMPDMYVPRQNITFHQLNDRLFLHMLANCTAFFGTAGFESICEALYLNKPVLIVPAHAEQAMNAVDAARNSPVITASSFDLSQLMQNIPSNKNNTGFQQWVCQAEQIMIEALHRLQ